MRFVTHFTAVLAVLFAGIAIADEPAPQQAPKLSQDRVAPLGPGGITIIESRFGAYNGWVDVTERVRAHLKNGRVQLTSLKPVFENLPDPAFGHHKALVVVYQHHDKVRMKIVPSDGVENAWGSLILPEEIKLLVAGHGSDNIVRFDLSTGQATVVAKLATGSAPWSLAVKPTGEMYVGLRGQKKNIVRLVPGATGEEPLVPVDLTGQIGRFGPGLMGFDRRGLLNVAGDTERAVLRFDAQTGQLVESLKLREANVVGLTIAGDIGYAAEYFQKSILRINLAGDPPQAEPFVERSEHLDRAHGMAIGHNGNLFVSNLQSSLIQEFNPSGQFVRTFLNVHTIGGSEVKGLIFEPRLDHYLLTSGDCVYEVSTEGALLARHQSPALTGAIGIAIIP